MGEEWLVDKEIEVDVHQLQDFAKHIKDELETNFRPSFERGIRPMLTVQAPFGGGGLEEGKFFRGRHDESRSAAAHMLGDAMLGLASLSVAASSISAEYLMGDAMAQATNDDVYKAFTAVDGQKMLSDYSKEAPPEKQPDGAVPKEAQDPASYFKDGDNDGKADSDTPEMYRDSYVAKGESGEYHIGGDDENMHDHKYDMPDYKS
jgi:hypothetical protein